ncbi:helix-turn-helix domain-containing protein [Streptomyces sp. NPDC005930]|uniref:helix-turn-helix domain-containing protein n=1 Tax=Streptomyces sp. NPDC005930 TaxID=3364736 RepID=UPI00369183B3
MNEPQDSPVRNLDARSLRGLAHPLRMRLLDALRFGGPATASQLAEKLDESSGATSYHLRRLALYGFIEDDSERGKGRERWWKAVHTGLRFDDALLTDARPDVRGAADMYLHEIATTQARDRMKGLSPMHPANHHAPHHVRAAELRVEADAYRLAAETRHPRRTPDLRTRLDWALVEVGLRLAAAPKAAAALI